MIRRLNVSKKSTNRQNANFDGWAFLYLLDFIIMSAE